jgi:hypothetical protein
VGQQAASEVTSPDRAHPSIAVPAAVGCVASLGLVIFGSVVGAVPIHASWWYRLDVTSWVAYLGFYLSLLALLVSWAAVGRLALEGELSVARCWILLSLWGAPLVVGPPLFSRDLYSYVVQGLLTSHGHNPYTTSPATLGHVAQWWSIASVWRSTPSPYGPLWVTLSSGAATVAGSTLVRQVITFRCLEIIGVVAMMASLPVIARSRRADPSVAIWLAMLSPLGLFSFLASGHNEAIMLGLVTVGGALIVSGRLAGGMAVATAAGALKLPALALPGFLGLDAIIERRDRRWRTALVVLGVPLAVLVGLSALSGHGLAWLSPSALKIPTELHILLTPSVSVAVLIAGLCHVVGIKVATATVIGIVQPIFEVIAIGAIAWLCVNIRRVDPVRAAGIALLVLALMSPTFWPWYLTWGLVLLAATPAQRSRTLMVAAGLGMCLVTPGGSPVLEARAWIISGPLVLLGLGWVATRGRWRAVVGIDG